MARRDGEVLFKGAAHTWGQGGGSTGADHPFRRKSAKAVARWERRQSKAQRLTIGILEQLGVPVGGDTDLERPLEELDRFVEVHGLEHRGVDVVLSRFDRARYDHDETMEDA